MSRRSPAPVVVLAGGLSHERDVSLRSGRRVAEALARAGVDVEVRDVDADLLPALARDRRRVVSRCCTARPARTARCATCSSSLACPTSARAPQPAGCAFDKPVGEGRGRARPGCDTPASVALPHGDVPRARRGRGDGGAGRRARPAADGEAGQRRLGAGCRVVRDARTTCRPRWSAASPTATPCWSSSFVPAPRSRSRSSRPRTARWRCRRSRSCRTAASTTTPPGTPRARPSSSRRRGCPRRSPSGARGGAHRPRGAGAARPVAHRPRRRRDGAVWFLEVNVAPGMTETSMFPQAVAAAGQDFGALWHGLRRPRRRPRRATTAGWVGADR